MNWKKKLEQQRENGLLEDKALRGRRERIGLNHRGLYENLGGCVGGHFENNIKQLSFSANKG